MDVIASTRHDRFAESDYRALQAIGIRTVRDGLRWHLVESRPRQYDWQSFLPQLHASRKSGTEVIWDIFHYGWPDGIDIYSSEFLNRYEAFARAFARLLREEGVTAPFVCPVNEINFVAWAGGNEGHMNPWTEGRGDELKKQLVRAAIIGTEVMWDTLPSSRVAHIEPAIHIFPDRPENAEEVRLYNEAQYQAWDMIGGYLFPELGGKPEYLDLLGINLYPINEWIHKGRPIFPGDPLYMPMRRILAANFSRYGRPLFVAETGIEGEKRAEWMAHIAGEVRAALLDGVPVQGLCWYPITDYPGWEDNRHCTSGVLGYADAHGTREWDQPLYREFLKWQEAFAPLIERELAQEAG